MGPLLRRAHCHGVCRSRWRFVMSAAALPAATVLLTSCSSSYRSESLSPQTPASSPTSPTSHGAPTITLPPAVGAATVSVVATLPDGFSTPTDLVAVPGQAGVYFWSASATDSRIWHFSQGQLTSWSLGNNANAHPGAQSALAVCGSKIWFGAFNTLLKPKT